MIFIQTILLDGISFFWYMIIKGFCAIILQGHYLWFNVHVVKRNCFQISISQRLILRYDWHEDFCIEISWAYLILCGKLCFFNVTCIHCWIILHAEFIHKHLHLYDYDKHVYIKSHFLSACFFSYVDLHTHEYLIIVSYCKIWRKQTNMHKLDFHFVFYSAIY